MIVSGFACPGQAWQGFLPGQPVVTLAQLLREASAPSFRPLAATLAKTLDEERPEHLVLHDMGVTIGLLALLRLNKQKAAWPKKIVVFNGAFRGFPVWKAPHPFLAQIATFRSLERKIRAAGGEVDPELAPLLPKVRALYREIILGSLLAAAKGGPGPRKPFVLPSRLLVLASENDPFIPLHCLQYIAQDFAGSELVVTRYRHFPYSGDAQDLRRRVETFLCQ